jgi:TolB-like protein
VEAPFAAYRGDEPCIFVCYAHEDSDVVYPEMAWLREQGLNLWYDEGISAGKNWRAAIGDSLLGARHILFYISARSLESDHCNREINLALDEGKDIVPIYLEDVELTSDLKVGLNRVQALHRDQDASYQQHLLSALGHPPSKGHPPTLLRQSIDEHLGASSARVKPAEATAKRGWLRPTIVGVAAIVIVGTTLLLLDDEAIETHVAGARSIAVLPFENLSGDSEQDFFSDGISEEIIHLLVQVDGLQVAARTSAFLFKNRDMDVRDVGRALGVETVLEGSVRRSGDRVRITAQLIDAETGFNVWSKTFDQQRGDILALQSEVAESVLVSLQATKETALVQAATAPAVYEDYLKARSLLYEDTEASLLEAADLLDDLLVRAPDDARIHAARARSWILLSEEQYGDVPMAVALASAKPHVAAALELAPLVADSHTVHGLSLLFERRFEEAIAALERATELAPGDALPWHWLYFAQKEAGGWAKGREALARAAKLDPLYPPTFMHYFFVFNDVRPAEALELLARFEDRWPNSPFVSAARVNVSLQQGDLADAHRHVLAYCRIVGYQRTLCGQFQVDMYYMLSLSDGLNAVGALEIQPPLLDAFMCPVDSLRPITALAKYRSTQFGEALVDWQAEWDLALNDGMDPANGAVYAASKQRWVDVLALLEPLAESREAVRKNLVSLHPIHVRFYVADLALARKMTGDEAGTEALLAQLEDVANDVASMRQLLLVSELAVHLLDMSIAAVKGDQGRAFASYERAYDAGYRFRSPVNEPLLLQWRDTEGFRQLQSRYDADIARERDVVLGQFAGSGFVVSVLPK